MFNRDYIPCPNCSKSTIEVIKTSRNIRAGMRSSRVHTISDNDVLMSELCMSCGIKQSEIRKLYKNRGVRFG